MSIGTRLNGCACRTLKPSTESISLRLPVTLLERIKVAANKRDVPYQSLIKTWLAEKRERAENFYGLACDADDR